MSVLVVLALTGFSTGRGHRSHGDDGGGGCSSSGQDHDGSSSGGGTSGSRYDDDDDGDLTTGGGGSTARTATPSPTTSDVADVRLERCATAEEPKARLGVSNYNATKGVFSVHIAFQDASGVTLEERTMDVTVAARDSVLLEVVLDRAVAARVAHCEAEPVAPSA